MYLNSFSDNSRGLKLVKLAMYILICAIAWQAAGLTWEIMDLFQKKTIHSEATIALKPSASRPRITKGRTATVEVPLFGVAEKVQKPQPSKVHKDAPLTSLALLLKGIVKINPAKRAMAIIAEKSKPNMEKLYSVGDTVPGNAAVETILFDRVILRRGSVVETLLLLGKEEDKSSIAASRKMEIKPKGDGVNWQIDRKYWNSRLADIPSLAKEVGVEIYRENNVQKGYRLLSARGSKLLKDLGLQPGDVLHEVNGVPLNSVHDGLSVYQKMGKATEVRLTISRNGKRESRVYRIGR